MSGIRANSSRFASLVVFISVLLTPSSLRRVCCVSEDEYSKSGDPEVLPLVTSLIYNQILNLTKVFNKELSSTLRFCTGNVSGIALPKLTDVTKRICTTAEMKFYFSSFMNTTADADVQILKLNRNCNLTSSVPGCEPGWACSIPETQQADLKNIKEFPDRVYDSQPCCAGFFCPRGLTCMISCPLGSYCPR